MTLLRGQVSFNEFLSREIHFVTVRFRSRVGPHDLAWTLIKQLLGTSPEAKENGTAATEKHKTNTIYQAHNHNI